MGPLERVLQELARGQVSTLAALAEEAEVALALLEMILGDLERVGYVQVVQAACQGHCSHCVEQKQCGATHEGRIWTVTQKGLAAAQGADGAHAPRESA